MVPKNPIFYKLKFFSPNQQRLFATPKQSIPSGGVLSTFVSRSLLRKSRKIPHRIDQFGIAIRNCNSGIGVEVVNFAMSHNFVKQLDGSKVCSWCGDEKNVDDERDCPRSQSQQGKTIIICSHSSFHRVCCFFLSIVILYFYMLLNLCSCLFSPPPIIFR